MSDKENKLGSKDFRSGVAFVLEELILSGYENRDTACRALKYELKDYQKEIFDTMKANNPDLFEDTILPELKIEGIL